MLTRRDRITFASICTLFVTMAQSGCLIRRELALKGPLEYSIRPSEVARQRQSMAAQMSQEPLDLDVAAAAESPAWTPLFSFIHVSDVQIRDNAIHYWNSSLLEKAVDKFAQSTVRDPELDLHDEYPWAALVGGLAPWLERNGCLPLTSTVNLPRDEAICVAAKPGCPQFMVHTGDAVDANSEGELHRFLGIANRSPLPWFDVVGNHDIFLMGNFTESDIDIKGMQSDGVAMILNRDKFMRLHGVSEIGPTLNHLPTERGCNGLPPSRFHGFDLFALQSPALSVDRYMPPLRGYYAFRYPLAADSARGSVGSNKVFRLIVLDTTSQHSMVRHYGSLEYAKYGARGYIEPEQFAWLKHELADAALSGDIVLLFGHHPLLAPPDEGSKSEALGDLLGTDPAGLRDTPLRELVALYPNVLAYFTGHTHLQRVSPIPGSKAWEITAPSLHEIPQSALLVTVIQNATELGLSIRTLRGKATGSGPIAEGLAASCRGAARDKGLSQAECRQVTSQAFAIPLGQLADTHAYCKPLSDPAPEPKKLIPTGLVLNLWQYGNPVSDNPKQAQLRLRGLLPVLSRLGPCLEFSFSPEVAGLAETPIFFDKSFDRDLPIFEALSALIERLPEATNGCGDSFKPILRQDERSGELRVLARRVKQGCASIMAPNGKK